MAKQKVGINHVSKVAIRRQQALDKIEKEFEPPKFPYILLLARKWFSVDGDRILNFRPFLMDISGSVTGGTGNYKMRLNQYLNKEWEIVKWRIPGKDEQEKLRDPLVGYSDYGEDVDHYGELHQELLKISGAGQIRLEEETQKRKDAEAKNDELSKRIAELENNSGVTKPAANVNEKPPSI